MATKQSRTQRKWGSMIQRCTNPNHERWKYYGGRGIKVCRRWRRFKNFLADMGEAPEGMWLDRIDNNKGYEPGNCRWVSPKEQANNRRQRSAVKGSLRNDAKLAGIPYARVYLRIRSGWSRQDALSVPKLRNGQRLADGKSESDLGKTAPPPSGLAEDTVPGSQLRDCRDGVIPR